MASSTLASGRTRVSRRGKEIYTRWAGRAVLYLITLFLAALFMGPFFWTLASSLKDATEITTYPPTFLPEVPQWVNYPKAWTKVPFAFFFRNSAIVALLGVIGQTSMATLVAYGFARFSFPGRNTLFLVVLSTLMIPREVTIIPSFLIFRTLGWLDTLLPLIVPHWFGGGPFFIFLMRQFFLSVPRDFDEAAKIDGAGALRILWNVLLPLCKPAMITVAIFAFLDRWNEFLEPLVYLNTTENFTIAVGLRYFQTAPLDPGEPKEHLLMAGAIMMAAPSVVLFFLAQRYFVQGIVMSGIKG